jgi:cell division protein FtsW
MPDGKKHIDWLILLLTIGLMLMSIAFVYSASASIAEARFGSPDKLFWNHTLRVLAGFVFLFIFMKIDYRVWSKYSKIIIFISVISLLLVLVMGTTINGANRWLYIGPINFQPSELAKFALVLHFAYLLTERQEYIKDFKLGLLPLLVWSIIITSLIAVQPNFSSAVVIYLIAVAMMFIGNANIKHLLVIGISSIAGLGIYALSAPYRMARLQNYIGLASDNHYINNAAFQAQQAVIAFGNGGVFGMGPGQSRQSLLYLPEAYGDFIFSIIGEEYGFVGTSLIIIIFAIIAYRGIKIAKNAPDLFGYFLAFGITLTITLYAFVSAGVNIGLLPTTGLPLPLISYGGTAIIFYCAAIGMLLNISANRRK